MNEQFTIFECSGVELWFAGDPSAATILRDAVPDYLVTKPPRKGSRVSARIEFLDKRGKTAVLEVQRVHQYSAEDLDRLHAGSLDGFDDGPDVIKEIFESHFQGERT